MHAHQICETTAVVSEAKHSGRNEGESMLGRPDSKGAFVPFKDIQKAAAKGEEPSTSEHTAVSERDGDGKGNQGERPVNASRPRSRTSRPYN